MTASPNGIMDGSSGMMSGSNNMMNVSAEEMSIYVEMFDRDREVRRTVEDLPNGIRTVTESSDPRISAHSCNGMWTHGLSRCKRRLAQPCCEIEYAIAGFDARKFDEPRTHRSS